MKERKRVYIYNKLFLEGIFNKGERIKINSTLFGSWLNDLIQKYRKRLIFKLFMIVEIFNYLGLRK